MMEQYDAVVVGCGAAGAATAWSCARRGLRVLALDRFEPGHVRGSSHGTERIVRTGHTDPVYVDLAVEALRRWDDVEAAAGVPLLTRSGAIDFGIGEELAEIAAVVRACGLQVEVLSAVAARRRFAGFAFEGDVLVHADGGTVHADLAVLSLRRLAAAAGADIRHDQRVVSVEQLDDGVRVRTEHDTWDAGVAVVTVGAWAPPLLDGIVELPGHRVTQEQVAFFRPRDASVWPAFIARTHPRRYGMGTPGGLVKVAEHHTGPVIDPDERDFRIEPVTWRRLSDWVSEHLPGLDPEPVDGNTCLYASTADEDFVFDRVGDVVIGAGLSGHGFKFVPVIGERLADLADGTGWPSNPFTLHRAPRNVGASGHK